MPQSWGPGCWLTVQGRGGADVDALASGHLVTTGFCGFCDSVTGSSQFPGAAAAPGLISSTALSQDAVHCWLHLTLPASVPRDGHGRGLGRWGLPSGFQTLIVGAPGWQLCSRGLWDRRGRGIMGQEDGTLGFR